MTNKKQNYTVSVHLSEEKARTAFKIVCAQQGTTPAAALREFIEQSNAKGKLVIKMKKSGTNVQSE